MCATLKPLTSSSRTIRLSLLSRMRQDGIERRGIDLEFHGAGRGQGECVEVGHPQAGTATGVGEGAIQLIAKLKRAGSAGLRIAGLEGVLERVVAAGGQVA